MAAEYICVADFAVKSDRSAFSKAKLVIHYILKQAREMNLIGEGVSDITQQLTKIQSDEIFQKAFVGCMSHLLNESMESTRISDLSYIRVYDIIKKKVSRSLVN